MQPRSADAERGSGADAGRDAIHVLHVDDDPDFRSLAAELIERADERFEVAGAGDADEGLERLSSDPVDCVVSDYEMPGRDGIEFLRAVREEYPDLPFVLFTGKGSEGVASEAISAGVTDYLRKGTGTDQYALLANRVRNAVESRRARRRAERQERINDLIRDINRRLVEAETADAIEETVCEALAGSESYRFAWIGEPDPETEEVVPRTAAGDAASYLDEVTIRYDDTPEGRGPGGRAVRTGEVQVARSIPEDDSFAPWSETAERYGYRSVVVLPLTVDEDLHGVLAIYAARAGAFDEHERTVLSELAETVGEALAAAADRRRLERYETILEVLDDGVYALASDDTIVYANGRYAAMKGVDRETLLGTDIYEWATEEATERIGDARAEVRSSGRTVGTVEYEFLTGEGERFPVELRFVNLDGVAGDIDRAGVIRDVTDRKERERTLERLQAYTRDLLRAETREEVAAMTTDAIREALGYPRTLVRLVSDDGTALEPVAVTPEAEAMLGERPVYRVGEGTAGEAFAAGETLVYDDVGELDDGYDRGDAAASMFVPLGEYGVLSVGDPEPEAFDSADVHFAEVVAATAEAAFDRVEETEARKRHNERLEEFVSIVSHDLRNPLNVVQGRLELARERHDDADLDRAADSLDRAFELIEDLLTVARHGGEGTAEDVEAVDLAEAVERCWRNVETDDATLVAETDAVVQAVPPRLAQLLENLIANAVDHGGSDVTVTVGDCEGGFYVEDDGPGIPPDRRDRVFEAGHSTAEDGTGFGLRIVDQIADAHGWDVRAVEGEAGGARFEITGVATDLPDGTDGAAGAV
ncbi:MAG: GAF domain-containing protein [Haloferacaceae archaeon]